MINFTVGPVQSDDKVRKVGGEQVPYFRTVEFSELMFENERLVKKFACAPESSRVVFLTGSGTASMEASVMNTLSGKDRVLVVNGGSFGERFVELMKIHNVRFDEIKLSPGQALTQERLSEYDPANYTAFVVNIHETSTGVRYDLDLIHRFCERNGLFLIVDAISSFLADELDFEKDGIDVMITSSQKALACPPGVSLIVLSERAIKRALEINPRIMYLNIPLALKNGERGQTPFTPAVGILRQINTRLRSIDENGGVQVELKRVEGLAKYFRERIKHLPFRLVAETPSNAVTALEVSNGRAYDIFLEMKDKYDMWVCPNGGDLRNTIFRVGHIGALTTEDYDRLVSALTELNKQGVF